VLRAQPGMEADVVAGGRVFHAEVAAVTRWLSRCINLTAWSGPSKKLRSLESRSSLR
jgi:hypothetical protein